MKLHKAGLVHGDLSEFNILVLNNKPVLIDFSQCSTTNSPNSDELIVRDVKGIAKFFSKLGVKTDDKELLEKLLNKT